MRSHVKSLEHSYAILECGALQEIGPHGVDHREQDEGQRHSRSVSLNVSRVREHNTLKLKSSSGGYLKPLHCCCDALGENVSL